MIGRRAAAVYLLFSALASVALACCGAERSLALMRHPVSGVAISVLAAAACAAALFRLARNWRHPSASLLFHLGFALVLGGWIYNRAAGPEGGYLELRAGQTGRVADAFTLAVRDFSIERYEDTGTVSQYRCQAEVEAPGELPEQVEISVNHPLRKAGWWVYQTSYRGAENPHTGGVVYFTILECVRDIGLAPATLGGVLLILGALVFAVAGLRDAAPAAAPPPVSPARRATRILYALAFALAAIMLVRRWLITGHAPMQNMYEFLMCALALLPVLTWISSRFHGERTMGVDFSLMAFIALPVLFFMDGSVKRLMPALQSPFFVPHVGAYVIGYLLLVRAALGVGRRLVGAGFFLLTVGLVLGAAWGKVCWGHWWQFDPKEMWSLATWFVYLAYFHLRARLSPRAGRAFLVAGAVMIALTLTWINLSRIFTGMHSYA